MDNWRADLDPFAKGYIDELYVCDDYTANPRAAICRVNNTHDSILTEMGVVVEAFQLNKRIEWRIREFGPLYVPKTGNQIEITPVNLKTYRKMIHYETGIWSRIKDDVSTLAGEDLKLYQFQTDWHFFGGDNVLNSRDSRYFGLVPEEYIIGVVYTNRRKHI